VTEKEDRVKKWVESKLGEGIEPDRLKKIMRKTGRDPSLVDEVQNPFSDTKKQEEEVETGENTVKDSKDDTKYRYAEKVEKEKQEKKEEEIEGKDGESVTEKIGNGLETLFEPFKQGVNRFEAFISWKRLGAGLIISIFGLTAPFIYSEYIDTHWDDPRECPDVGVAVDEAWVDDGSTFADVRITLGGPEQMVLEVFEDGERTGYSVEGFAGDNEMVVEGVEGDRVVFRPTGCDRYSDSYQIA